MSDAARVGFRVVSELEESSASCNRVFAAFGDEYPQIEESSRTALARLREAEQVLRDASVRLRYLGGHLGA